MNSHQRRKARRRLRREVSSVLHVIAELSVDQQRQIARDLKSRGTSHALSQECFNRQNDDPACAAYIHKVYSVPRSVRYAQDITIFSATGGQWRRPHDD